MSNSPRLAEEQIKKIRVVARKLNCPMTKIVHMAVADLLQKYEYLWGEANKEEAKVGKDNIIK